MDGILEPWDSSDRKANELILSMFGTADEVAEMAKPIRMASTRYEAAQLLKGIVDKGELISRNGVKARLTPRTISKIVSNSAINNTIGSKAHYLAAANIDKYFTNAIEPWKFEMNPAKHNDELKARRYLFAPMEYQNRILPVKFTVKEYKDPSINTKIYSIEAIDVDIKPD
jgi:ABC-type ATPase with predicted acetyltransferase domain